MTHTFALTTADPLFRPDEPLTVNGFAFVPAPPAAPAPRDDEAPVDGK